MIHNPRTCNAFHSACENWRDAGNEEMTLAELDASAELYVQEEMSTCTCEAANRVQPNKVFTTQTCPDCDGQGVQGTQPRDPQQQEIWDCPTCEGTGRVTVEVVG